MNRTLPNQRSARGAAAFQRGLCLGFAAPLIYLGPLPPYADPPRDNIARSWREVGDALRGAMRVHAKDVDAARTR